MYFKGKGMNSPIIVHLKGVLPQRVLKKHLKTQGFSLQYREGDYFVYLSDLWVLIRKGLSSRLVPRNMVLGINMGYAISIVRGYKITFFLINGNEADVWLHTKSKEEAEGLAETL
jgi:hypothetical protein